MKKKDIMSRRKIIVITVTTLIIFSLNMSTTVSMSTVDDYKISKPFNLALTLHGPIEIITDDNFTDYGFPGSGTDVDPYIIQEYNITTTSGSGISIEDTTKYFVIRDCYIDADIDGIYIRSADGTATIINNICNNNNDDGIYLWQTSSILINNTCNNNNYGICMYGSAGSTLTNNICNNNDRGIILYSSLSSTLTNNTCNNNNVGIDLDSSSGSTLADNTCTNNLDGINVGRSSFSTWTNNTCTNNIDRGIYVEYSSEVTLTDNTCTNNNYGIYLLNSDTCLLTYNLLQENEEYGIYLSSLSDDTIIYHNYFVDNNLGGISQANDNGTNNFWHNEDTKLGNYWSGHEKGKYSIDGSANSLDPYPLKEIYGTEKIGDSTILLISFMISTILITLVRRKRKHEKDVNNK